MTGHGAALITLGQRMDEQLARLTGQPARFSFDRNGLRLAIAAIEDETGELYGEWKLHKRHLGSAREAILHELLDIAAVAMIAYEEALR